MNKRIFLVLILLCFLFTACSNDVAENDVTDETVLTPPEQTEGISGIWSCEFSNLSQNNYFYGDGKFVSLTQDIEEDAWCTLALWKETDKNISLENQVYYKYNSENEKWEKVDSSIGIIEAKQISDDQLDAVELLPDGNTQTVTNSRENKSLQIPHEVDINLIINDFLIH